MTTFALAASLIRRLLVGALLCLLAGMAWAQSAYSQGDAAYKRGDYRTAAAEFRRATQEDTHSAKAFWRLGLALRKENDLRGTLAAWDQARSLDPSLSFASSPDKFNTAYDQAVQKAGAAAGIRNPAVRARLPRSYANPSGLPVVGALIKGDAYVDPSMSRLVDEARLEQLARSYRPQVVKIAVLQSPPVMPRDKAAEILRPYIGLHQGTLILVTGTGGQFGGGGVSVSNPALSRAQRDQIVRDSLARFSNTNDPNAYYNGIQYIADRTVNAVTGGERRSKGGLLALVLVVLGGIAALFGFRRAAQRKRIQELNSDITTRLSALQDEFKRFDLEAAAAKDSLLLQEAKQLRAAAVDPFAAAGEKFNAAATVAQYEDADRLTTQAEKLAARARVRLDQATGKRPLDSATGVAAAIPDADDVPESDRGACFFCSKPARLQDLHPLRINVEGQARRVLACDDCYEIARTGRQPQILAVPDEYGQRVPWYQSSRYDPWADYGRGGGIFGGGGFGLMDYLLLENLFDHDRRSNTTIIYPQDPGYAERYARDAGGAGFGDSTWPQPERGEGDFFGGGPDVSPGQDAPGAGDFLSSDSS